MDRRTFVGSIAGGLIIAPLVARSQQPGKVWRIGYLGYSSPGMNPAFEQALRERGYVEGTNVVFERRFADGKDEQYPALAAELVRQKVDVLVTNTGAAADGAKEATATIPIVIAGVADPVGRGLVPSLARPGGNITGVASLLTETNPKRIELLREVVPKAARFVTISYRGGWDDAKIAKLWLEQDAAAQALGVALRRVELNAPSEFDAATAAIVRERPDALLLGPSPLTYRFRSELAELALRQHLPTIAVAPEIAQAGIMMSYGPNTDQMFRDAAIYVDKILKGTNPADLPIEQPTKFRLVINLKTAKALGLTIPQSLLLRADEVIQ
jgi:ABC-type uncharacterized transport system substrate-binding protein